MAGVPVLLAYLALLEANQAVRLCGLCPCCKPARDSDNAGLSDVFATSTRQHIAIFQAYYKGCNCVGVSVWNLWQNRRVNG